MNPTSWYVLPEDGACSKCRGCGKIANDEHGTAWIWWEDLPEQSKLAVRMGVVKPIECPRCGGSGRNDDDQHLD